MGKQDYDGYVMCMEAKYLKAGMLVASGDLSEKNDWAVLSVARDIAEPRHMVVELEHVATGRTTVRRIDPAETTERKAYRSWAYGPVQPKPSVVE